MRSRWQVEYVERVVRRVEGARGGKLEARRYAGARTFAREGNGITGSQSEVVLKVQEHTWGVEI